MPPKRRSSGPATSTRNQQRAQSTLSFGKGGANRVTKPTAQQVKDIKALKKDPELLDTVASDDTAEPTTADVAIEEQTAQVTSELPSTANDSVADPLSETKPEKVEDVLGGRAPESEIGAVGGRGGSGWVGGEEERARKISDSQVKAYWRAKERERKAPRVHQEGLTVGEKVLREWDMSGQYGPCIGIARLKRWKRANMLGLSPPIEVLAVLLKGVDQGDTKMQRAHVDELMSSRFIET